MPPQQGSINRDYKRKKKKPSPEEVIFNIIFKVIKEKESTKRHGISFQRDCKKIRTGRFSREEAKTRECFKREEVSLGTS